MALFVTIGGGTIKRAKGRFGGDSKANNDERSIAKRSDSFGVRRRFVAEERRFAAAAIDEADAEADDFERGYTRGPLLAGGDQY